MDHPKLQRLYMGKSMKDLNNMVKEIPSANPKLLVNSAQKVLKEAYSVDERNDEEKAYVLFMRYFSIVATIQKQAEYKKNKRYYDSLMDPKTTSKVIIRAESLQKSLERRYTLMYSAVTSERIEEKKFIHNIEEQNEAEKRSLQATREAEEDKRKQEKARAGLNEDEGTMSCQKLYCLVKEKCSSFLILDVRPSDHFKETRMRINNVINIPEELSKPGLTAGKIGRELSQHERSLWLSLRTKVDFLIICDWETEGPLLTQPINALIDAMLRWDPGKQYASRPWILKGGFDMWRLMYPIHTTNPHFQRPAPAKEESVEDDALDFEYPDLDQAFSNTPNNSAGGNSVNGWDGTNSFSGYGMQPGYGGPTSQPPMVIRGLKPSMVNEDAPSNNTLPSSNWNGKSTERNYDMKNNIGANVNSWDHKDTNKIAEQNRAEARSETPPIEAPGRPVIPSRSLKPEAALASLAANKTVMDAEQQLLEESVVVEGHTLEKMRQKEETTSALHKVQDESTRRQLQDTEDRLNIEIEQLKAKGNLMEERYSQVHQQNKELWTLVNQVLAGQLKNLNVEEPAAADTKLDLQEQEKQDNAVKQSEDQLRESEVKRQEMQEQVVKMRRARKEKEKRLQDQEKALKIKEKADSERTSKDIGREIGRNSPLRQTDKTDAETRPSRNISGSSDTYTANLRRSPRSSPVRGGSNLKRSHSAFNLSQLEDEDSTNKTDVHQPNFDRSIKPLSVTPRKNNLNIARQRNFEPKHGKLGGNRTGLKNLGNTCYMNSIIQCLNNTTILVKYFVGDTYCDDLNESSRQRGEVAEELGAVIKAMWCNQYRSISLWDLKSTVGRFHKPFQGYDQHDAHEFLIKFMDWLRDDLNKIQRKVPPMKEQNHDGIPDYVAAEKVEEEFRRRDQSIITTSFHGLHRSSIECSTCKHRSLTFEPFSVLTLSFPSNGRCSLRDMLNHYYKDSSIEYTCSKCKKMRNCIRKTDIWKLPPLLIIHLNRFEHDVLMRKKQNYVEFPLENLDLSPYVPMNNNSSNRYSNFECYGVSNHYGTMDGGHYTAFCKSSRNSNWFKFDDHEVYELSRENAKSSAAYILFYEATRCHT